MSSELYYSILSIYKYCFRIFYFLKLPGNILSLLYKQFKILSYKIKLYISNNIIVYYYENARELVKKFPENIKKL